MSFFELNLDYVFFLSGLALAGIGAASAMLLLERERSMSWAWLACYGIFSALLTWAAAIVIDIGDAPAFMWARLITLVVSTGCLFEFGRRSLAEHHPRVPGIWLSGVATAAPLAAAAFGIGAADAAARLVLGSAAWVLTALAFADASSHIAKGQAGIGERARRMLYGMAALAALYGLCSVPFGDAVIVGGRDAAVMLGPVPLRAVGALIAFLIASEALGYSAAQQVLRGEIPSLRVAFSRFHAVPILIAVVALGGFAVTRAGDMADSVQRGSFLKRTLTTAASVDADHVEKLTGTRADLTSEDYLYVRAEMERLQEASPDVRHFYILRQIGGHVVVQVDCAAKPEKTAQPGTLYAWDDPKLTALLDGRQPAFVEGPVLDSDGYVVKAVAPVREDGKIIAAVAVDIPADTWVGSLASNRATAIALVLVASVLVLGTMAGARIALDTRTRIANSVARLRSTLASAPDGIAIIEPESHRIEFANPTLSSMLGLELTDLVGLRLDSLVVTATPLGDLSSTDAAPRVAEHRMLTATGEIEVEMTFVAIMIDEAQRVLVYAHDVTARRAAERRLQERITLENIVRAVSGRFLTTNAADVDVVVRESLGSLGAVLDVDRVYIGTVTQDGLATRTHEWCSPGTPAQAKTVRSVDLSGFPWFYGKLRANEFVAVSTIDDIPEDATSDRAIMVSQGVISRVVIPLLENGVLAGYLGLETVREARTWSGERIALLTVFADVLAAALRRARAEADLAKLTLAVTNSPAATVITDAAGTIEYVNPRFQELSGYSADELIGANPRVLKSGKNDPGIYDELWTVLVAGGDWRGEFTNRRKDGSLYAVAASISSVRDATGGIHYVGVQEDITALKLAEDALRAAADTANAANRAKSDFLAAMSHEIRTPMNAIIGMGELLDETELTDEQRRYTRIFRSAGESLLALINDILDLSKIEAGHFEIDSRPFELETTVEEMAEVLAIRARDKGVDLLVDIDPETPRHVVGDPDRIRQVLVNLVGNAVKFTEKGHVLVSVAPQRGEREDVLRFSVTDTGIGIPEDKLEKVFEAFTQADSSTTRRFGGTGLGLTISRRLVDLMGGALRATSVVGEGSTFSFHIPLVPAENETTGEAPSAPVSLTGIRTLVVDDSTVNRLIVRRYLEHEGALVIEAEHVDDALALMRTSKERFDVVLTDVRMPERSGFEFAEAIGADARHRGTPIIVISSDARPGDERRVREVGALSLLIKPIRRQTLIEAVAEACAGTKRSGEPFVDSGKPSVPDGAPSVDTESEAMNILLVEDTEDNRMLALAYMKATPHRVVTAENGMEAVEAYKAAGAKGYDIVLMDMQMPIMDGYAATREIRQIEQAMHWPHTPVVALTAYALADETRAAIKAGCDDYLTKPIKKATLLDAIARYAGR